MFNKEVKKLIVHSDLVYCKTLPKLTIIIVGSAGGSYVCSIGQT